MFSDEQTLIRVGKEAANMRLAFLRSASIRACVRQLAKAVLSGGQREANRKADNLVSLGVDRHRVNLMQVAMNNRKNKLAK